MKTIKTLALALGFLVLGSHVAPAQDVTPVGDEQAEAPVKKAKKKKKEKAKSKKASSVPAALKKVKRASGKVNQKALIYVYLQSASWCGPCRKAMPDIVKIYKEMRKDKRAEIVLVGWDRTPEEVKDYIEGYKCKMPAFQKETKNVNKLPGLTIAGGIPHATIVDASGKVLRDGYPTDILPAWKSIVEQVEAEAKAAAEAAEAAEEEESAAAEE